MLLWTRNERFLSVGLTLSNTFKSISVVQVRDFSGWAWNDNGRVGKKWAYQGSVMVARNDRTCSQIHWGVGETGIKNNSQIWNLSKRMDGVGIYEVREKRQRNRFEGGNQMICFGHVMFEKPI